MRTVDPRLAHGGALVAALVLILLSWQRGYQAAVQAFTHDQARVAALNGHIAEIETLVQSAGGQAPWLAEYEQRLAALKAKFPAQAELPQLLNALVETLKAGEIQLLNVAQGNLEPLRQGEAPLLIEGAAGYRLPVTITAEARYHTLLDALERLTGGEFPCLVSLGQVELRRKDAVGARLDATVQLYLYVTGASNSKH